MGAFVGEAGTVIGVTVFDGAEAAPDPAGLVATTVNEYAVPLVSPVTVTLVVAPSTLIVAPPGETVTV